MTILLAALPLLVIVILMMGLKWGGAQAGLVGWISAMVIAALFFGADLQVLYWAQVQGLFRALYVLYIIWGALFFFRVTEATGTLSSMRQILQHATPDRTLQVLLLSWGFASFLQGVGGFGVPVAVVAPILVSLGLTPLHAVMLPSLGHAWAISFGSLGASYEALISATGLEAAVIGPPMAIALGFVCFVVGFIILYTASEGHMRMPSLVTWAIMAATMSGVQYLSVHAGVMNIAAMLGALAGLVTGGIWALVTRRRTTTSAHTPSAMPARIYGQLIPYLLLIVIILVANLAPTVKHALNRYVVTVQVPALTLRDGTELAAGRTKPISLLGHPGAQLVIATLLTLLLARLQHTLPPGSGTQIRQKIWRSGIKSTIGIATMMAMATTMQNTGMVTILSEGMARLAGQLFPLIAPFIGALGAFLTGSNTNSNVLLGAFQLQVAQTLKLSVPLVLALHNAGAAVGSIFAPAKIIVGCSTVGLTGGESEALRSTARYGLLIIVALGGFGMVISLMN